ncbi:hypothetical protein BVH03_14075 [Pseudomonas sp. PA15(2017)]|uniref:DUF1652 domain-containing protein n=1 Tax=Pseudomonas sp. PA15(2017) TaxID=1932111 RepID=UPI00095F0611|nr:DUF1652 domain-containing protein [Pseudomonas sp. PA15(2017)]OLU27345.1 hypothetical protein BVH03_14075 [Pseudomonas sp. PA15(2017)]
MMSILEQRQIIESAFLPLNCRCLVEADDTLTVQIRAVGGERVLLGVKGIQRNELSSSRSISQLVLRLRQQVTLQESTHLTNREDRALRSAIHA